MILAIAMNPAIDKVYAVDDFTVNKIFRAKSMAATAGGKGLNVARVARTLGETVMVSGFVGGSAGQFINNQLRKIGIISEFVQVDGETRTCINILDEKNGTSTEVLEPGPIIAPDEYRNFLQRFEGLLDDCDVITASGSLPQGVPASSYRELISIARTKGKKFILDTSGEYLREGIKEGPFMVKPNQHELSQVMGYNISSRDDCIRALKQLKKAGVCLPVATLGDKGCVAALHDGIYHFYSPPIKVVSPVGSGDAFVAGCAVALSRGREPVDVIKLGMACGMANTQFFETGMVSNELVDRFLKSIQIEIWSREDV
ncbi:MAG: 1-phosphofructokinase family hexose kinase [Clostridiales bacterium]|nr:1-phosphofructokinase family hexose kinase [Clostridiales bacterium]